MFYALFGHSNDLAMICQLKFQTSLKEFQCVFERGAEQGNPTLLKKIYTELCITEGESGEVNIK
jgi:hypothetical protein